MQPWIATFFLVLLVSPVRADMGAPQPGGKEVPCDVEIELPANLNGYRLFFVGIKVTPQELVAGQLNRLVNPGYYRSAALMAIPATSQVELNSISATHDSIASGRTPEVQVRVKLHIFDRRIRGHSAYRVDRVSPDGTIELTTLHEESSTYTIPWCLGSCIFVVALPVVVLLAIRWCAIRYSGSREPT